ncbi:MAG: hypothetical protein N2C14_15890, partial [Planctomycetales bacterium]
AQVQAVVTSHLTATYPNKIFTTTISADDAPDATVRISISLQDASVMRSYLVPAGDVVAQVIMRKEGF